jgi:hypothetical protein
MIRLIVRKLSGEGSITGYDIISWCPPKPALYSRLFNNWELTVHKEVLPPIGGWGVSSNDSNYGMITMPPYSLPKGDSKLLGGYDLGVFTENVSYFEEAVLGFNKIYANNSNLCMGDVIWEGH